MGQEEPEFKIKGAASNKGSPAASITDSNSPPASMASENSDDGQPTVASKNKSPVAETEEAKGEPAKKRKAEDIEPSFEELKEKYKMYKCVDPESKCFYYVHLDTNASTWEEPDEPYWIYDEKIQDADQVAGLQKPTKKQKQNSAHPPAPEGYTGFVSPEGYWGYYPPVHGSYDPNAEYAKYNDAKRAQEAAQTTQAYQPAVGMANYDSTMTLNRFTGNVQRAGLGPERHSDDAKASRQLGNFFNIDDAANAHDGRSLKEERRNQKISKKELKAYKEKNAKKKEAKKRAWLTS